MMDSAADILSPQQLGFMPGRFIGDHVLTLQLAVEPVKHQITPDDESYNCIGLLLDQGNDTIRYHQTIYAPPY